MTRKRKTVLLVLPVMVLILALAVSGTGLAGSWKTSGQKTANSDNGKGVIHTLYQIYPDNNVYNAIYHVNKGKITVTGSIYPKSGPLKTHPKATTATTSPSPPTTLF